MKWKGMSSNLSMTSPSFTFGGESSAFDSYLPSSWHSSSYANRSARFVSAYRAGLSGSQAIWANRKYHSHRTLPPEIVAEVKRSVIS
jgi:hypothetical protein